MTIKEFKEIIKDIPDDVNLGIMFDKKLSDNTLDLISVELLFNYSEQDNMFTIATVRKNYLTMKEAEEMVQFYENKLNEYRSKESNIN